MLRVVVSVHLLLLFAAIVSAADPTAKDFTAMWEPVEGLWNMTNDADGKITTGIFNFRISRNGNCVLLYHGDEGGPFTQQLQGYDPVAKKLVAYGFTDNGNFQIQTIGIDGMTVGKKVAEGLGGDWEHKIFRADGAVTTTTSKWKFLKVENDEVVMEWSDIAGNDPDQPKRLKMTLQRRERRSTQR